MKNIKELEVTLAGGVIETYVIIDLGNGEYRSLPKAKYEEELAQREQSGTL